jgi:membrane protein implicated in regulation of membrane protease activity
MLEDLFTSGTLNLIYTIIVFVSFIFAVITFLGAEVGEAFDFDADVDSDADFDFISISPFAMAMFGTTFGSAGLITRLWLEMDAIPSILWAVGTGVVIGGLAQVFFLYVLSPTKSSHFNLASDASGREAEVIITVPKDGLGQIAFDNVSGRVTLGARSATGKQIKRGEYVRIQKITGRVALVEPIEA